MPLTRASVLFTRVTLAALPLLAVAPAAHAQLVSYTSLTTFQTAFPVTTLENFEGGKNVNTGNGSAGPLDSSTNDTYFSPGAIAAGLRLNFAGSSPNEYYYNTGFGLTSKGITTNRSANSMDVILLNSATALGFDLSNGAYTYQVFSSAGTSLGTGSFNAPTQAFLGFSDTTNGIGRVNLVNSSFETIDNIRFNNNATSSAAAPEPASIALLLLAGVPAVGLVRRRKSHLRNDSASA